MGGGLVLYYIVQMLFFQLISYKISSRQEPIYKVGELTDTECLDSLSRFDADLYIENSMEQTYQSLIWYMLTFSYIAIAVGTISVLTTFLPCFGYDEISKKGFELWREEHRLNQAIREMQDAARQNPQKEDNEVTP